MKSVILNPSRNERTSLSFGFRKNTMHIKNCPVSATAFRTKNSVLKINEKVSDRSIARSFKRNGESDSAHRKKMQ
jgi:hypothetical protein